MPVTAICTNLLCSRETVYPDDYLYCIVECSHCKKKFKLYPLSAPVSRGGRGRQAGAPVPAPAARKPGKNFSLLTRIFRDVRADWRRAFQRLPAQQRVLRKKSSRRDADSTPPPESCDSDDALLPRAGQPGDPDLPRHIGRFLIRAWLGRGGFGTVYRAYDPQLERDVALKVPKPGTLDHPQRVQRFLGDARAAARLRHPHIVSVFDAGQDGAHYYIASAYVEGHTLKQAIDEGTLTLGESVRIVRVLAEALAHAHSLGIVHRDVKPANVMLDCMGQPHLIDFGLAHRQHLIAAEWTDPLDLDLLFERAEGEERTRDGAVFGTPVYMAPEQARGRHGDPLPASDQYSLGVMLYELLCGQTPFDGPTPVLLFNHVHTPPLPPSTVNAHVPPDLEAVCLKALAKRPEKRYAGCQELADDLGRCLEGEPIRIRHPGPIERLVRWCRREPRLAGAVGAAAIALLVAFVLAVGFGIEQARLAWEQFDKVRKLAVAREKTEDERQKAESAQQQAEQRLASSLLDRGQKLGEQGEVALGMLSMTDGLAIATRAHASSDLDQAVRMNLASWSNLLHPLRRCLVHRDKVWSVAVSPDGKTVLTGSGNETKERGEVRLWDLDTGAVVFSHEQEGSPVRVVAFSPDGRQFVTGTRWEAQVWDAAQGKIVHRLLHAPLWVTAAAFSPDGRTVATGCSSLDPEEKGEVRLWDVASGQELWRFPGAIRNVWSVAYSPDGRTLAAGSGDRLHGEARLWDAAIRGKGRTVGTHQHAVHAVAFSPEGKALLTTSGGLFEGEARVWEIATNKPSGEALAHQAEVYTAAYSPDGRMLLTGGQDRAVRLWNDTGKPLGPTLWHPKDVRSAAFTPDGRFVATGSEDGTVRIWEVTTGSPFRVSLDHGTPVLAAAWSHDGKTVLTGVAKADLGLLLTDKSYHFKGEARLYDAATGQPRGQPLPHDSPVMAVALSPDGRTLATGSFDGTISLWDAATSRQLGSRRDHTDVVSSIAFSPDGQTLATGSWDHTALLHAVASLQPLGQAMRHDDKVYAVAFNPVGQIVATGSRDETAQLWQAATGEPVGRPLHHPDAVLSLAFSPDGGSLLAGYAGGARLWEDAIKGKFGPPFPHQAGVFGVAFSPDGKTVLTGGTDRTARLWNTATRKPLGPPLRHAGAVMAVVFAPDGKTVLTGSLDGTTRLWDVGAPLEGGVKGIRLWTEVQTGIELNDGVPHVLSGKEWQERCQRLGGLPGAPKLGQAFQAPGKELPIEPQLPPSVVPIPPPPSEPAPVAPPPTPPPAADVSAPVKPKPPTGPATPRIPSAEAEPGALERYLPDDTEMVLRVNVRQVLDSALAKDIGLKDRLKQWLRTTLSNPAEAQQVLDDLGLDLFRDINLVTIATPGALDNPLIVLEGMFDVARFQAKADKMARSDLLKVHPLPDGQGKVYETNLPTLPRPLFVKLISKSTLVLAPDKGRVLEALDKEAGRKKTALRSDVQALLDRVDPRWSIWAVAPGSALEQSPLGNGAAIKELVAKVQDVFAGITIDKDMSITLKVTARKAEETKTIADGLEEGLDQAQGFLALVANSQPEMKPLLNVLRNTKPNVKDKAVMLEARFPGSDIAKAVPKP
jgi:WD40 repeat protein/tRNA A-37 threonylcarbamoyl transferase component Bud32